jgi:hypothetical protein
MYISQDDPDQNMEAWTTRPTSLRAAEICWKLWRELKVPWIEEHQIKEGL